MELMEELPLFHHEKFIVDTTSKGYAEAGNDVE
jgi:hypothetical protein